MGLFDKFKKRIKDSKIESDITAEEDTKEAKNAILDRKEKLNNIQIQNKDKQIDQNSNKVIEEEWDDIPDKSITNPFYDKHNSKERKFAKRAKSMENNVKKTQLTKVIDNMHTTTGKKLIPKTTVKFHFDFANEEVKRGGRIIKGGPVFDEILEELEIDLLSADIGHTSVSEIIKLLRMHLIGARINKKVNLELVIEKAVKNSLLSLLNAGYWDFDKTINAFVSDNTPVSIMMVGVNGTGKTTTAAKLTHRLTNNGYSVVLAAADTFRAGAIDQLTLHAEKLGVRCVKSQRGGDAAAISRDAIESAKAKGDDIVIIDTAGRMQNKTNLMNELQKVHRVTKPHLVLFVADALAGNDAVLQAKEFQKILEFDGAVLTKLDTDARGGAALSISHATGKPIVLAGIGQEYKDLKLFDPNWLLESILN